MTRVITLPSGKRVTLTNYLFCWRELKKLPPDTKINDFFWWQTDAAHVLRTIRNGVHDRINQRGQGLRRI